MPYLHEHNIVTPVQIQLPASIGDLHTVPANYNEHLQIVANNVDSVTRPLEIYIKIGSTSTRIHKGSLIAGATWVCPFKVQLPASGKITGFSDSATAIDISIFRVNDYLLTS